MNKSSGLVNNVGTNGPNGTCKAIPKGSPVEGLITCDDYVRLSKSISGDKTDLTKAVTNGLNTLNPTNQKIWQTLVNAASPDIRKAVIQSIQEYPESKRVAYLEPARKLLFICQIHKMNKII